MLIRRDGDITSSSKAMIAPLNGTKTHPLTEAALSALAMIKDGPLPTTTFNPGVINRLQRGMLARIVNLPSPYRTHRRRDGYVKSIGHLEITDAGRAALADIKSGDGNG